MLVYPPRDLEAILLQVSFFRNVTDSTMTPERTPKMNNGIKKLVEGGLVGLDQQTTERFLPKPLQHQLDHVMHLFSEYNKKLPKELKKPERALNFVAHFYASFLTDRNRRAEEITENDRYEQEATERARKIVPIPTFFVLCMDGRVKPVHTNGFTADMAGAIRTPGGLLSEFVRTDGKLKLQEDSNFAKRLLLASARSQYTAQVFDSHFFCAARTKEEAATGNHPADFGLRRDIIHKKEMFHAVNEFLDKNGNGNKVVPIQTSFNPVTGYMYMGLETDHALEFSEKKALEKAQATGMNPKEAAQYAEYSKDVVKELVQEGKVISTGQLIAEPTIREAFERNRFDIDRQHRYVESAVEFWTKMETLWAELLPTLKEKLIAVYPELGAQDERTQKELEERTLLLLSNAFNTYLHNDDHDEIAYLDLDDSTYEEEQHYEYGVHNEAGVKISEGGHPPYDMVMFVIYSEDLENQPAWVELASGIVRTNRSASPLPRVDDLSGNYKVFKDEEKKVVNETEKIAFEKAPVCLVNQEIIRNVEDPGLPEEDWVIIPDTEWQRLERTDWSDMPKNWESMTPEDFENYLVKRKRITHALIIEGIENLRQKMARLYEDNLDTASHLKDLYKTALPIVCDQNRRTHAIIPFLKVGREDSPHLPMAA